MISARSIRFQLLVAVNTAMAVVLCVFLVVDYHQGINQRMEEKRIALEEEAKTLLGAVLRIRPRGTEAVRDYVNDICGQMQEALSPGHHIAVRSEGMVLQAVAHHRASPEIFEAMQAAAKSPTSRARFGEEELLVGSSRQGELTVYVSEYVTNIRRAAGVQILNRLARIALLAVVAALVVNVVFLRVAARPLRKLVNTVEQIAQGQLGVQVGPFAAEEFAYLADAVNSMSSSLAETDQRRRREMARARRIQEELMPDVVDVPGLTVVHLYQPADEVAGDYYDVMSPPDGRCLVCIADVSGHGVPAAMSAMMLKALLLHATEHGTSPAGILQFVNHRLATVCHTENLASMFLARCDPRAMTLEYASAGHEAGLLLTVAGTLRELPSTGLMLGVLEDALWETETLTVGPGDRLLLATDGVTEALSPDEDLFGRDRLARLFSQSRNATIGDTLRRIDQALRAHRSGRSPIDDTTMLAVEFGARKAESVGASTSRV